MLKRKSRPEPKQNGFQPRVIIPGSECPKCGNHLAEDYVGRVSCSFVDCDYEKPRYKTKRKG